MTVHPFLQSARDFYNLDARRLEDYRKAGIANKAIKRMQQQVKPPKNQKQQKKTKKVLSKVPQPRPKPGAQPKPQAGRKPADKTGKGKPQHATQRPPMHEKAEDWGFLPDFLRDEVLQRFKEGYLQQYRDLLEQYYIRLSEKGKGQGTR